MFNLSPENLKIVEGLTPAADAAGRTGDYVSMKDAHRIMIVAHIDQGNAATIALTPTQATAVAGTGAKAIPATARIWSNLDCAASDVLVRRADAADYTTDAGVKHKIVVFVIDADQLDVTNGFDCIALVTGASNAANITSCQYYLETRYPQASLGAAITN